MQHKNGYILREKENLVNYKDAEWLLANTLALCLRGLEIESRRDGI